MSQDDLFSRWIRTLDFVHWCDGKHLIDAASFLKMQARGEAILLDVRDTVEAQFAAFPKALHIPIETLPDRLDEIPADKVVATFCSGGDRAAVAYAYLQAKGFEKARILKGGYAALMPALMPGHLKNLKE